MMKAQITRELSNMLFDKFEGGGGGCQVALFVTSLRMKMLLIALSYCAMSGAIISHSDTVLYLRRGSGVPQYNIVTMMPLETIALC